MIDRTGTAAAAVQNPADTRRILAARGLRSFAYGLLAVVIGVGLSTAGYGPAAIGAIITVSLVGDFCGTYVISLGADRWGRRRTLLVLALLMAATGAVFGITRIYAVLLVAAFFGTLGTSASETAPFLPIEQASLTQITPAARRTDLFARYNLVAWLAGACGALVAGLPDLLSHAGLSLSAGIRLMFGIYTGVALIVVVLVLGLSEHVEAPAGTPAPAGGSRWRRLIPALGPSRRAILLLAGLFSVDALAGGLVVQSLMVLYLHLRFGVDLGSLGVLFFCAYMLSALSFLAVGPVVRRVGLLNTMVFSHLPSNVLLMLIPVMPHFALAAVVILARQLLSQLDVPTRQAYTMALVAPEERTAAAAVTSLSRSAGAATSPVFSGLLLQGSLLTLGIPFLVAGALKIAYDLALWSVFRRVRVDEERLT